ncbi:MAG TPA: von Willebrand factor type A domain-containing protein, partial [Planctomycetota bacterium]|nr:von Willebrand factor type A domain-containing protein [Planctomycetota bacterium]
MSHDTDDPKITAYALGELDETDRAEMEAKLAATPRLADEVEATRAVGALLETTLRSEEGPQIGMARRAAIERRAAAPRPVRTMTLRLVAVCGAAAAIVLGVYLAAPTVGPASAPANREMSVAFRVEPPSQEPIQPAVETSMAAADRDLFSTQLETIHAEEETHPGLAAGDPSAGVLDTVGFGQSADGSATTVKGDSGVTFADSAAKPTFDAMGVGGGSGRVAEGARRAMRATPRWASPAGPMSPGPTGPATGAASPNPTTATANDWSGLLPGNYRGPSDGVPPPRLRVPAASLFESPGTEAYSHLVENDFRKVADEPLSTFAIDVDTASYSNVRRFLEQNQPPPVDAVRVEEIVNAMRYAYRAPAGNDPFSVDVEIASAPWKPENRLVRVALKAREVPPSQRESANLVFLVDVSGSMAPENKLPLLKSSLRLLVGRLEPRDRVAIVTYAGTAGVALQSTSCAQKAQILSVLDGLAAGGSTNGEGGIQLAYEIATQHFIAGGTNRVILATDGDFNVGMSDEGSLVRLIQEKAKSGVFLTVLGFGMGNLKDANLEKLADRVNGHYAYLDSLAEARRVLARELHHEIEPGAASVRRVAQRHAEQRGGGGRAEVGRRLLVRRP